ncbi:MAG: efflux RND transporter periplasmic adaptor subunit [Bacteroidetes bacterium]|nr:MAG: efflux RND transporter periplasmic adaptor subunit [Bacteroidota bacterium]
MNIMNRYFFSLPVLVLALFVAGCGAQQNETLEAKQAKLKKLNNEMVQLKRQIQELEKEIVQMDPSLAKGEKKTVVLAKTLKPGPFLHFIEVQGTVEANQNIAISPQVGGSIVHIAVKEGQQVRAGQVLARVDDAIMQRNIEEVKTSLELATIMYEKQKNLWEQEIGTEVQYLTAKNQKESLERRLKTLEEQWDKTNIKAPISGTVDEIMVKIGETVSPGYPAFRIVSSRDLSLKAKVSEAYIPYVKKGDRVKLYFPVLDKQLEARVSVVGQSIHPVDRSFDVEVKLPDDPSFKANMYGQISINDRKLDDAIVIPMNVVQKSEQGAFVFVAEQEDGKWVARRRMIQTGLSNDGQIVVSQGLKDGDRLIIMGGNNLSNGQEVVLEEGA